MRVKNNMLMAPFPDCSALSTSPVPNARERTKVVSHKREAPGLDRERHAHPARRSVPARSGGLVGQRRLLRRRIGRRITAVLPLPSRVAAVAGICFFAPHTSDRVGRDGTLEADRRRSRRRGGLEHECRRGRRLINKRVSGGGATEKFGRAAGKVRCRVSLLERLLLRAKRTGGGDDGDLARRSHDCRE